MNSFPGFTSDERMNSGENATRFQPSTSFLPNFENLLNNADDYSRTLFVGDISLFCDEKSLYELFSPFGVIDSVQLKKCDGDMTKSHLSYGFVKFRTRESAEIALKEVNGVLFLGRNIRVGWAVDHPSRKSPFERFQEQTRRSTAQIHVTFASRHPTIPVTEASLRSLFSRFGDVVDVTIKKTLFNKELGVQSGYGFIHYGLNSEGVNAAINAVEQMNHATVDLVSFECSLSHGLRSYLANSSTPRDSAPRPFQELPKPPSTLMQGMPRMPLYSAPSYPMKGPAPQLSFVKPSHPSQFQDFPSFKPSLSNDFGFRSQYQMQFQQPRQSQIPKDRNLESFDQLLSSNNNNLGPRSYF